MSRFNETRVNSASGTVDVGAGLTWDQVYATLESTGVNVVGGRIPGVGVAGLTLGGGECLPSSECSISYVFRLFIFDKSVRTYGRQRCWI
jgi:hypothetical protein